MSTVFDFLAKGGPVMVPIVGASVLTISCALERTLFWSDLLRQQGKVIHDVLEAATRDLDEAAAIANQHLDNPMGRFLLAPLKLRNASPETFRLAMETAADREFIKMRRGDKLLETIVAISPLLGLLGTVTGLIGTFYSLDIGGGGGEGAGEAAAGIGEALITTAAGMVVAILALVVLRTMVTLQSQQTDQFADAGNELELIYRQYWYEPALLAAEANQVVDGTRTPEPILRNSEHQR
ncbi:MAG: MotA/TolQ/ExbB proton channel family protein [Cyanobacteria bacterium J06632_22]